MTFFRDSERTEKKRQKVLYLTVLFIINLYNLPGFFPGNVLTRIVDNDTISKKFDVLFFRRVLHSMKNKGWDHRKMVFTAFRRQLRKRSERGNVMWFVLYCPNQKETEVIRSCMRHLTAQALTDAFVLTYDRLRRYEGAWHMERRPIFPDCIFLESEDGECLVKELDQYKRVPYHRTLSGSGSDQKRRRRVSAGSVRKRTSFRPVKRLYPKRPYVCDRRAVSRERRSDPKDRSAQTAG